MSARGPANGRYILDGHRPVEEPDLFIWGRWMQDADRVVRFNVLEGGTAISTVFLGLDHQYGDGPPLLFETMVFRGPMPTIDGLTINLGASGEDCQRYSTWEEAEDGHVEMLKRAIAVNHPVKA
jgi:hypothetical protein